ncbi:MAG: sigma-70 family RNA polymerase sigma factor [Bacillota bacterium]|nr:sigma-70 family RNA polymerase sigma factor [Bacillota bacterium]
MVLLIRQGNDDAFEQIFDKYKNEAVRTAYLITGKKSICEDIAQEAFIKCYKHIGKLKNPAGFRAWFLRILTRTAWKYGREAGRETPAENIFEKAGQAGLELTARQYFTFEENRRLYAEIGLLEKKLKTVIVLYYFNGLSTKEIAKATGCLEGTVKSRLFTARKRLKSRLEIFYSTEKEKDADAACKVV